ncbi:Alpha/beta hydrolase family-domain-containing protein [Mycena polygramma]|nr:Alpha/beta hydrolase family-domain-containing protein [Mycena polygramma]
MLHTLGIFFVVLGWLSGGLGQQSQGTLHRRTYFYVGATYTAQGNSSIADGQMYVEHLIPAEVTQPLPLLFIHDYFLSKGYELYIIDQPSRARSPWQPSLDGALLSTDSLRLETLFTAVERFKLWPQAILHTQWPGNGSFGDPIFDNFFAATVPSLNSQAKEGEKIRNAGSQLLDQIGPVILLTHSQAGQFGWILADARPKQVKAIVALEPTGPPFISAIFPPVGIPARVYGLTDSPVVYDPPISSASDLVQVVINEIPGVTCIGQAKPARKLINLIDIPVLAVTSEASYHTQYDNCSVDYLRNAGVSVDHIYLSDVGIHCNGELGNGHMFFMEKNGLQIADEVIQPWISKIRS